MTDKEIQEDNKLIAEFMGYKCVLEERANSLDNSKMIKEWVVYNPDGDYMSITPYTMFGTEGETKDFCIERIFNNPYHTSWNWLMPVVEKIESIKNITTGLTQGDFSQRYSSEHDTENIVVFDTIEVVMQSNNCGIIPLKDSDYIEGDPIVSCDGKTKFDATYKAVVGFIKWYNDKNK